MFNNLPKGVLEYMSPQEVVVMVAELREEADRLEAWNKQRGHWQEPAPRWPVNPPPKSLVEYGWRDRSR